MSDLLCAKRLSVIATSFCLFAGNASLQVLVRGESPPKPITEPCPSWLSTANAPLCPEKQGLLDNSYPEMAHVFSDELWTKDKNMPLGKIHNPQTGYQTLSHYAVSVLSAHRDKPPFLFFNGTEENFKEILSGLESYLDSPAGEEHRPYRERWIQSLKHIGSASYQWNQDYMEFGFSPGAGAPAAFFYKRYTDLRQTGVSEVKEAMRRYLSSCGASSDGSYGPGPNDSIPNDNVGAYSGGNIEGLPQGHCLVGNNAKLEHLKALCPSDRTLQIETDWLRVGHVDEIVSLVPLKNPPQGKCSSAVLIASPRKALELLRENPSQQFFNGTYTGKHSLRRNPNGIAIHGLQELDTLISQPNGFMQFLCEAHVELKEKKNPQKKTKDAHGFLHLLLPKADATINIEYRSNKACEAVNLTGEDFLRVYDARPEMQKAHDIIQASLDRSREKINQYFQKNYGCNPEVVEVPSLYSTAMPAEKDAKPSKENPTPYPQHKLDSLSAFPNPTNAVISNGVFIGNHSINPIFSTYIESNLNQLGVPSEFVFTYTGAHKREGNLHCSTNVARFCKPRN